jgi:Bifunctional DNA primase/polymerase, N-terminal
MIGPLIPIPKGRKGPVLIDWQNLSPEHLAAEFKKGNGFNVGVRLDHYAVLDPDTKAAGTLLEAWEREGKLPPTVAWQTAAGNIKRLYQRPQNLQGPLTISGIKLQLRTGAGMQDVIPPSYVKDDEKGIDGVYAWLPDQDPKSMDPAPLPQVVLEYFKTHSHANTQTVFKQSKNRACVLDFLQGGRDESLFHVATVLRNGGMAREDAEQLLINLAKICDPPFPEKDALRKIESAWKHENSEINLAAEAREWVLSSSGVFMSSDFVREAGLSSMSSREFSKNLSKVFERLVKDGVIERGGGRRGQYRRIERECEAIDFFTASSEILPLKWPFELEKLVNIYRKNLIVVAGASNAGKTALLLNVVRLNMGRFPVHYFSSEMGSEELRLRLEKFDIPLPEWNFKANERGANFADAIRPDSVNVIDFLEITDNFYKVAGELKAIFDRLTTGIAIVALQKRQGAKLGRGGDFSMEKARLYLSMEPGELTIVKGKNWAQPGKNPNGLTIKFKLIQGAKFINLGEK